MPASWLWSKALFLWKKLCFDDRNLCRGACTSGLASYFLWVLSANPIFLSSPFHSTFILFAYLLKIRDIIFCSDNNISKMFTIRYYKLRLIILFIQHWPMSWKVWQFVQSCDPVCIIIFLGKPPVALIEKKKIKKEYCMIICFSTITTITDILYSSQR